MLTRMMRGKTARILRCFKALRREAELYREHGWRFSALYVSGGTPTVLPDELAAFLRILPRFPG